jgi:asparagine synthase (glutamine-hydrolysing)
MLASRRDGSRPFFFADAQSLAPALKAIIGREGQDRMLGEAEQVLSGHLPFFGQLSYATEFPPQWFRNPITGQSVSPGDPWIRMRFASSSHGDLKFILEPSRFLFVYPMDASNGDERFPQAFWQAIDDWAIRNPPMEGPLWICGQECSLRILAWCFALHAFIHSPSTTPERASRLVSMIAAHAWRTAQTLDYARSQRSNHLISEAVGLWTTGTLFPELVEAKAWQNLGAELLHEAVVDHITPAGVSQQHSFNYQRMILHQLLWTLQLSKICNAPLHRIIHERTQAAYDFMSAWVDQRSGSAPKYGADDGSLILPLANGAYQDFRPLLQLGARILDRPTLKPGPWDEAPLWFGANERENSRVTVPAHAQVSSDTGYFRLGNAESWALIRAGNYTRRPFQADQLHVDLWWKGLNLARDAGTYLYNASPPWDNALARTAVHNTVTINQEDQMLRAGRFLWVDWAQACGQISTSEGIADRFVGEHNGYRRFGVTHRRCVRWLSGLGWVIIDDLGGSGEHDLCLHWRTADLPFEVADSTIEFNMSMVDLTLNEARTNEIRNNEMRFKWSTFSSAPGSAGIIRAGNYEMKVAGPPRNHPAAHLLGWEASTYGDLRPAISLVYQTRSQLPVRFVTVLLTGSESRLEKHNDQIVIFCSPHDDRGPTHSEQTECCRVSLTPGSPIHLQKSPAPAESILA